MTTKRTFYTIKIQLKNIEGEDLVVTEINDGMAVSSKRTDTKNAAMGFIWDNLAEFVSVRKKGAEK